jgi:hypothetical protein
MKAEQGERVAVYAAALEGELLHLVGCVLFTYQIWREVSVDIRDQIADDFRGARPDEERTRKMLQHVLVVMEAVEPIVALMRDDANEVVEAYYTWLYD